MLFLKVPLIDTVSSQAPAIQKMDSAIHLLNNWAQTIISGNRLEEAKNKGIF